MPAMLADTFILNRRSIAFATAVFAAPFVHEPQMVAGETQELPRRELSWATETTYHPFIFINPPTFLSGTFDLQRRARFDGRTVFVHPYVQPIWMLPGDNPEVRRYVLPKLHPDDTANVIVRIRYLKKRSRHQKIIPIIFAAL